MAVPVLRSLLDEDAYGACELCPRRCGVDRRAGMRGRCGQTSRVTIARAALHLWEEPPISGETGSGAIFFSGCTLGCVFCQNHAISHEGVGVEISWERLADIMVELQDQGALNINLVTPGHFAPTVVRAIDRARERGLILPIVCNTGGYERVELVRALADHVDVWLTDFKYASSVLAAELSGAADYPDVAGRALAAMVDQLERSGGRHLDGRGAMDRGVIVRHLVLPGHVDDSLAVLDRIWEIAGDAVDIAPMNQYTPNERCRQAGGDLARAVSPEEYDLVLCHGDDLGFSNIWWQEGGTVSESFVPPFDLTGVLAPTPGH